MNVLLDHCVPKALGFMLSGHHVRTTHFEGWDELKNGELLVAAAAKGYQALLTADRGIQYQQHQADLPIPVIVLMARGNEIEHLEPLVPDIMRLLGTPLQRQVYAISLAARSE